MAKKKKQKTSKEYGLYKKIFKQERAIGNIKNGVRMSTFKEFKEDMKEYNNNIVAILNEQRMLTPELKKKVWRDYKKFRKQNLKPGDYTIQEGTYWGGTSKSQSENIAGYDVEGLDYHTSLSGLLHDKHAVHFLISRRIADGENQKDVLAEYGYTEND